MRDDVTVMPEFSKQRSPFVVCTSSECPTLFCLCLWRQRRRKQWRGWKYPVNGYIGNCVLCIHECFGGRDRSVHCQCSRNQQSQSNRQLVSQQRRRRQQYSWDHIVLRFVHGSCDGSEPLSYYGDGHEHGGHHQVGKFFRDCEAKYRCLTCDHYGSAIPSATVHRNSRGGIQYDRQLGSEREYWERQRFWGSQCVWTLHPTSSYSSYGNRHDNRCQSGRSDPECFGKCNPRERFHCANRDFDHSCFRCNCSIGAAVDYDYP